MQAGTLHNHTRLSPTSTSNHSSGLFQTHPSATRTPVQPSSTRLISAVLERRIYQYAEGALPPAHTKQLNKWKLFKRHDSSLQQPAASGGTRLQHSTAHLDTSAQLWQQCQQTPPRHTHTCIATWQTTNNRLRCTLCALLQRPSDARSRVNSTRHRRCTAMAQPQQQQQCATQTCAGQPVQ